jgi:hypothetical protein
LLAVTGLAVALALGIACSSDDDGDDTEVPPTLPGGLATLPAGLATLPAESGETDESEADFALEVQDKLTALQNDLVEIETTAAAMEDSVQSEVEPLIEQLRTTVMSLENRYIDLQATPEGPDREAVKADIEDMLAQAQAQVSDIQAEVGL